MTDWNRTTFEAPLAESPSSMMVYGSRSIDPRPLVVQQGLAMVVTPSAIIGVCEGSGYRAIRDASPPFDRN